MDSVNVLKCAVGTYFLRWLFSDVTREIFAVRIHQRRQ